MCVHWHLLGAPGQSKTIRVEELLVGSVLWLPSSENEPLIPPSELPFAAAPCILGEILRRSTHENCELHPAGWSHPVIVMKVSPYDQSSKFEDINVDIVTVSLLWVHVRRADDQVGTMKNTPLESFARDCFRTGKYYRDKYHFTLPVLSREAAKGYKSNNNVAPIALVLEPREFPVKDVTAYAQFSHIYRVKASILCHQPDQYGIKRAYFKRLDKKSFRRLCYKIRQKHGIPARHYQAGEYLPTPYDFNGMQSTVPFDGSRSWIEPVPVPCWCYHDDHRRSPPCDWHFNTCQMPSCYLKSESADGHEPHEQAQEALNDEISPGLSTVFCSDGHCDLLASMATSREEMVEDAEIPAKPRVSTPETYDWDLSRPLDWQEYPFRVFPETPLTGEMSDIFELE